MEKIDLFTLISLIVAVVVVLKLRSVLGRRTGDEEARLERYRADACQVIVGERALSLPGGEIWIHDRGGLEAMPQPQGVTELVHHHRLEVVLAWADRRRVVAKVVVPVAHDRDLVEDGHAQDALAPASQHARRREHDMNVGELPVARGDLNDRSAERSQLGVEGLDRVVDARRLKGADFAARASDGDVPDSAGDRIARTVRREAK